MIQYNKEFELKAYKEILTRFKKRNLVSCPFYLCDELLQFVYKETRHAIPTSELPEVFPLFYKHKPNPNIPNANPWWSGNNKRSRVAYLEMLIEEMEKQNDHK